jgi:hypothetical protein
MDTTGKKVGGIGGLGMVVCFFLPWVLVSCGGQSIATLSGWDLAAGKEFGFNRAPMEGDAIFFLVLLCGIAAVTVSWFKGLNLQNSQTGYALMGAGALALLVFIIKLTTMRNEYAQYNVDVEYQFGFFGVILSSLAVIYGGWTTKNERENIAGATPYDMAQT